MSDPTTDQSQGPADLSGALSQLSGSGASALQSFQSDSARLDSSAQDLADIPAFDAQKEMAQQPQINRDGVMATMPYALGLTALAGAIAGVHPQVMLGAMDGVQKGLIQGNDKAVQESWSRYNDAYDKWKDRYQQQFQIYKQMQAVYRGDVNADLKALDVALKATGYQGKIDQDTLRQFQWSQKFGLDMQTAEDRRRAAAARQASAGAEGGALLDPDTLELAKKAVAADPAQMRNFVPTMGKAGSAARNQINAAIAADLKSRGDTPETLIEERAVSKGEVASIGAMLKQKNSVAAFEEVAKFNGQRLIELAQKMDNSDIPLIAGAERLASRAGGDADAAEFASVLNTFQTEAAKIINNPNLTGQLTDTARQELQAVVNGNMPVAQLARVIPRLISEMDVRATGIDKAISDARSKLNPGQQKKDFLAFREINGQKYGKKADGKWYPVH